MGSCLDHLVGSTVKNAIRVHDYHQLFFEEGAILNVYNDFEVSGGEGVGSLEGAKVEGVEDTEDAAALRFSGEKSLRIDLRDAAYSGPEALALRMPGKPVVVWN